MGRCTRLWRGLQPEIVHLHHYVHVGIDLIHALKRWFPQAGFLFTFHEYWAPCAYEGRLLAALVFCVMGLKRRPVRSVWGRSTALIW